MLLGRTGEKNEKGLFKSFIENQAESKEKSEGKVLFNQS